MQEQIEAITVREMFSSDRSFLTEMLYQAIFIPPGEAPAGRDILEIPEIHRYEENWGRMGDFALVAEKECESFPNIKAGLLWIRYFPADAPGYGFIDETIPELSIAIKPEFRGRGIGSLLLKTLLARPNPGYSSISLSVDSVNPAVRLYQRFGFTKCGETGKSLIMRW